MSVLIYHNNHLIADRAMMSNGDTKSLIPKSKIYLDPRKRFAVGQVGTQISHRYWVTIYSFLMTYIIASRRDSNTKTASDQIKLWATVLKRIPISLLNTHILIITHSEVFEIYEGILSVMKRNHYYTYGTGGSAARVLIQAKYPFDLDRWFSIISMSDRNVSRQYDVIDLSVLKDYSKDIKNISKEQKESSDAK